MTIKILRNVLGEEHPFFISFGKGSFECTYTLYFKGIEPQGKGVISPDYSKITLNEPIELEGYINGINPPKKKIKTIIIPKHRRHQFKENILGIY